MMFSWSNIPKSFCIMFAFSIVLFANHPVKAETVKEPQVSIDYFYINACGSCNEEGKFRERYDGMIGKLDDHVDVSLQMYNTFHGNEAEILKEYEDRYKVPEEKRQVPILFINGTYLSGTDEINAHLKQEFIKAVQSPAGPGGLTGGSPMDRGAKGPDGGYGIKENNSADSTLLYFYLTSCDDCSKAAKILKTLKGRYRVDLNGKKITTGVVIRKYNAGEAANIQLLKDYFEYYGVPEKDRKVPVIFSGGNWYSGADEINRRLEKALSRGEGLGTIELQPENGKPETQGYPLAGYGAFGVVAAGLVNGLNPCSLSIVLFFLSLLAAKNVNVLRAGITFISGKFIMFFLLGTLLYQLFLKADIDWFQLAAKMLIVVVAVLFVFLNVQDMFFAKKEKYNKIRLQLPEGLRRFNHSMVKAVAGIDSERVFLPLSFLLGMVIAAGEFLCTGQIYLTTIVLVLYDSTAFDIRAMIYFLLYGIAFVLPLLVLTVIVYKGKEVFEVSEAVRAKMPLIKMINALVFFVFALFVIILF